VLKHAIFFALSFAIANVFLAYIIGADALIAIVTAPPGEHWRGLVAISIFSLVFYGVFARFREQACTLACPYGRVMSALIDSNTVTVTYDRFRGEPRGHRAAHEGIVSGDCIDCGQCVTVCPTGIDIRNGIQLECVNCAACIDACDAVMIKVQRPVGLIRMTSHEAIKTGRAVWLTPRVKAYAAIWIVLALATGTLIARQPDLSVMMLRQPGTLFAEMEGGIGNFYNLQVINRTNSARPLEYAAVAPAGASITALGDIDRVAAHGVIESRLIVRVPASSLTGASTPVRIEVRSAGVPVDVVNTMLLGPGGRKDLR
jgi:cytochrome c oxidase accessory protein FixG